MLIAKDKNLLGLTDDELRVVVAALKQWRGPFESEGKKPKHPGEELWAELQMKTAAKVLRRLEEAGI